MTLLDAITEVSAGLRDANHPARRDRAGDHERRRIHQQVRPRRRRGAQTAWSRPPRHRRRQSRHGSIEQRERAMAIADGSRATGGQHVTLLAESAVQQAMLKLARELSSQYKVVYGRPESLIPPEKIEVDVGAGRRSRCVEHRPVARRGPEVRRCHSASRVCALVVVGAAANLAGAQRPQFRSDGRHRLAERHGDRRRRPLRHRPRTERFHRVRGRRQAGPHLLQAAPAAGRALAAARQQREHGREADHAAGGRHQLRQAPEAQRPRADHRLRQPRVDSADVHVEPGAAGCRDPPDDVRRLDVAAQRHLRVAEGNGQGQGAER